MQFAAPSKRKPIAVNRLCVEFSCDDKHFAPGYSMSVINCKNADGCSANIRSPNKNRSVPTEMHVPIIAPGVE